MTLRVSRLTDLHLAQSAPNILKSCHFIQSHCRAMVLSNQLLSRLEVAQAVSAVWGSTHPSHSD